MILITETVWPLLIMETVTYKRNSMTLTFNKQYDLDLKWIPVIESV